MPLYIYLLKFLVSSAEYQFNTVGSRRSLESNIPVPEREQVLIGIVELDKRPIDQHICTSEVEGYTSSIGNVKGYIEFRAQALNLVPGYVYPGIFQVVSQRIETLLSTI